MQSAVLAPQNLLGSSNGISRILQKLIPKNPIEQMYEGLESQGITPGEEEEFFALTVISQFISHVCAVFLISSLSPQLRKEDDLTHLLF